MSAAPLSLVTGATGFTGGRLVQILRERGLPVRVLVRPGSDTTRLREIGAEFVHGALTNESDVRRAAAGANRIFHIAAAYRAAGHPDSYYHEVNVGGTQNVLRAAREHGAFLVHCSTMGVHGHVSQVPSDESSPFNPGDIYQRTKLAGELEVRKELDAGLPGAIVRPGAIYGPGDMRFLKLFRAVHRGTFRMFGSGKTFYHMVFVDDLVEGMLLCAQNPAARGETFLLVGPEYLTLTKLVELVAQAVGVRPPRGRIPLWPLLTAAAMCEALCRPFGIEPPLHRRRAEFFIKDRAFTFAKAQRLIGYTPEVAPAEGLALTAQWYFDKGHLPRTASTPARPHAVRTEAGV